MFKGILSKFTALVTTKTTAVAKPETLPVMAVSHPATLASVAKRNDETEQNPDTKTKTNKAMKRDAARAASKSLLAAKVKTTQGLVTL